MQSTPIRCFPERDEEVVRRTPVGALQRRTEACPDDTAFIAGEETWTYRHLASESERLASAMLTHGIQAGDRIALHMANLPELAVAYYACFRIGGIAAPLNIRLKTAELKPLLHRLQPALYLGQAQLYPQVALIGPEFLASNARFVVGAIDDDRTRSWASLVEDAAAGPIPCSLDIDAPAVLLATSGTTGVPKFVAHTPATLFATAGAFVHLGLDGEQIALNCLPMAHVSGLSTFLAYIQFGVPMILLERFDPDAVLNAIEAHRCSYLGGLSFMFAELLRCQRARPCEVGSLRHCLAAGDACPPDLQQEFLEVFGVPLRSFWAATEAFGTLTYGLHLGPVSRTAPCAQVQLVVDASAPVPRGTVGELLVRGPSVSVGYWTGPGRIEAAPDGWFHTGDLMRQGDGDDLWFVARKKHLIVRGGSNISPVEVERVLMAHPAVRDAAVVGAPDPLLGQRVAAVVQLAGGAEDCAVLDDIAASASARLADYKVPERLQAVAAIPRNAAGKIDRQAVLAMVPGSELGAFTTVPNPVQRREPNGS